jgi:hypothetical protein
MGLTVMYGLQQSLCLFFQKWLDRTDEQRKSIMPSYQDYMARAEAQLAASRAMDQRFERIRQQNIGRYQEKHDMSNTALGPVGLIVVGSATASSRFRRFLGWFSLISMAFGAFMGIAFPGLMGVNPQGGHNPYAAWLLLTMIGFLLLIAWVISSFLAWAIKAIARDIKHDYLGEVND